jgi:hypothetical protein
MVEQMALTSEARLEVPVSEPSPSIARKPTISSWNPLKLSVHSICQFAPGVEMASLLALPLISARGISISDPDMCGSFGLQCEYRKKNDVRLYKIATGRMGAYFCTPLGSSRMHVDWAACPCAHRIVRCTASPASSPSIASQNACPMR